MTPPATTVESEPKPMTPEPVTLADTRVIMREFDPLSAPPAIDAAVQAEREACAESRCIRARSKP